MANRISKADNIFRTTLTASVSTTSLNFPFASVTGLELPQYLVLDPQVPARTEIIYFDGAIADLDVSTTLLANRDQEGSVGAVDHDSGAEVWASPVGQHIEDLHDRVNLHDHSGAAMGSALGVMSANLDMGGFQIDNVGTVDGLDLPASVADLSAQIVALEDAIAGLMTQINLLEQEAAVFIRSYTQASGDNDVQTVWSGGGNLLATYSFVPRAVWGTDTYAIYATGRCNMNPSSASQADARLFLRIDGEDGSYSRMLEANATGMITTGVQGGCSGPTTVQLRGSREGAVEWTAGNIEIIMWARRL